MSDGREKKTLALFAAIMLFGFSCICAYVFFGHNWNFAVSQFDDTFGDMESYTVILYEGTVVPSEDDPQGFELTLDGSAIPSAAAKAAVQATKPDSQKPSAGEAKEGSADESAATDKPEGSSADSSTDETTPGEADASVKEPIDREEVADSEAAEQTPSFARRIARKLGSIFNLNTDTAASEEETEEVEDDPIINEAIDVSSIDKAAESYQRKNAVAFVLDSHHLDLYQDGMVLDNGGKRIAVFSVTSIQSLLSLQEKVDYLKSMNVDMTIAMVDEVPRVAGVEGLDMVIRCNEKEPLEWDSNGKGRYMTFAPAEGTVAATIISPSNIVVTRVF